MTRLPYVALQRARFYYSKYYCRNRRISSLSLRLGPVRLDTVTIRDAWSYVPTARATDRKGSSEETACGEEGPRERAQDTVVPRLSGIGYTRAVLPRFSAGTSATSRSSEAAECLFRPEQSFYSNALFGQVPYGEPKLRLQTGIQSAPGIDIYKYPPMIEEYSKDVPITVILKRRIFYDHPFVMSLQSTVPCEPGVNIGHAICCSSSLSALRHSITFPPIEPRSACRVTPRTESYRTMHASENDTTVTLKLCNRPTHPLCLPRQAFPAWYL